MSIVKSSPREATFPAIFSDFFNNDPFFRSNWPMLDGNGFVPAVNIRENEREYKLELAVPGYRKEDFKVEVEDEMLRISAERTSNAEEKNEQFTRKEYSMESFERSFSLPSNAGKDNIHAQYHQGMLRIQIPKKTEAILRPRKEIMVS
jgi:HSP20 family protein